MQTAPRAIRSLDGPVAAVPILAYTTMPLGDDAVKAAGMDGRLPKPCSLDVLLEIVAPWRPDAETAGAERLAAVFGRNEIMQLVMSLRQQLVEAIDALDEEGNLATAHRIAGAAGTLGFLEVSSSWFRLSEGDLSARDDARRDARLAIAAIDRDLAAPTK